MINEPLVRGQSFVCAEYTKPACYRRKPKIVAGNMFLNSRCRPWSEAADQGLNGLQRDIGKRCRSRSDAAKRGV